jgi:hypothetical protein
MKVTMDTLSHTSVATSAARLDPPARVRIEDLARLDTHAKDVMAIAMKLTDSWGQAMFIMDGTYVAKLFSVLGFSKDVSDAVYEHVRKLGYVNHKIAGEEPRYEFTWHITDAACMTLRGAVGLGQAMSSVTDANIEQTLLASKGMFDALMDAMPDYSRNLMFSPEVAAVVMGTLGASVSADKIYDLAWRYGGQTTRDLDGRRGVSTQFVRSLTLAISSTISR